MSKEDERAQRILDQTFTMKDGHYETGLLWKADDIVLPDNRKQAEKRLESLKRRLQKEPSLEQKYRSVMDDYLEKGYARRLSQDEVLTSGEILQRWQCWKKNLRFLSDITVPRCYFGNPDHKGSSLELHNFSDASEAGYGSVSYLRITYPDGNVECSFVAGKSRNAPLNSYYSEA